MKIHGQGQACDQRSRLHCWLNNQSIYFLSISHQSALPLLRYSYLKSWPWNSKVKVTIKVLTNGYIWGLVFNRYVIFRFVAIGSFCQKIQQIPYLILKIQIKVMDWSHWSHLRLAFNQCSDHFWLRYSKVSIGPRKFKIKFKAKPDGHIWSLEIDVCFSFRGNQISKIHIWPWKFKVKVMTKKSRSIELVTFEA